MAEQHEGDSEARESLVQRRLRLAEDLATQKRKAPEQRQRQHDDRPPAAQPLAATVPQPLDPPSSASPEPTLPTAPTPPARPAIAPGSPPTIDADWPLLREFVSADSLFRQLSIGDLLDAAFRLYRRRFAFFVAIAALLLVPTGLLLLLFQQSSGIQTLALFIQNIFMTPLISATLIHCVARTHDSATSSIRAAYRVGLGRYLPLLLAMFVEGLLIGIPMAIVVGCLGAIVLPSSIGGSLAALIFVVVLVVLLVLPIVTRLALANQAIVLEQCGPVEGLKRSWYLTSGWFWRTFWVSTCAGILTYLIGSLPALAIEFVLGLTDPTSAASLAPSITTVVSQAGLIVALPLQAAISTLLYVDLRIRREGYDLEMLARQAEPPNI